MGQERGRGRLPIVQYWHSEAMPAEIVELTTTFRELNPDLHHRVYCEAEADEFIGEHYTPREVAAFRSCAVPAMQADYFRYCAVLELGGVYADVDFRCLRSLRVLVETTAGGLLFRREPRGNLVNNFFTFDTPGHPLLRLALDVATANIERRAATKVHAVTGPWIFTGLAALHRMGSFDAAQSLVEPGIERLAQSMTEAIGDFARVEEAFERVQISPMDMAMEWIGHAAIPLPHKQSDTHWVNWHKRGAPIFRSDSQTAR